MWTLLYVAFGIVALWLLGEVLLQYKARLRWRLLAFVGFLGVVMGVLMPSVPLIGLGVVVFAVGQVKVTLSYRRGFSTGWALGGGPGSSRRRRETAPPPRGYEPAYDEPPPANPYELNGYQGAPGPAAAPAAAEATAEFSAFGAEQPYAGAAAGYDAYSGSYDAGGYAAPGAYDSGSHPTVSPYESGSHTVVGGYDTGTQSPVSPYESGSHTVVGGYDTGTQSPVSPYDSGTHATVGGYDAASHGYDSGGYPVDGTGWGHDQGQQIYQDPGYADPGYAAPAGYADPYSGTQYAAPPAYYDSAQGGYDAQYAGYDQQYQAQGYDAGYPTPPAYEPGAAWVPGQRDTGELPQQPGYGYEEQRRY